MPDGEVWIYMTHPDVEGPPVKRTLTSFLNLHERKGWVALETPPTNPAKTSRETFKRVFGDVAREDATKGPKKAEAKSKPTPKSKPKPKK